MGTLLRRRSPILSDIRTWLHSHARFAKPLELHRGHTDKVLALILFRPTIPFSPKSSRQAFKRPDRACAAGWKRGRRVEPARPCVIFFMFPLAFSMPAKIILVPRTLALGSYRTERDDVSSAGILRHNQDHLNSRIMIEERTHGVQLQKGLTSNNQPSRNADAGL